MPMNAMIFAAGKGTRMGALTAETPKPMLRLRGRPLIDYALDLTEAVQAPLQLVNLHRFPDQIADHLADRPHIRTLYEPELLETGGGLRNALPILGGAPLFTLNSDALWLGDSILSRLAKMWDPARMGALLLLCPLERSVGHSGKGDFALQDDGQITRGGPLIYTGAQIIDPSGLHQIPETVFSLKVYWAQLAAQNRLFGLVHDGMWADVGTPDGLAAAEALLEARDV